MWLRGFGLILLPSTSGMRFGHRFGPHLGTQREILGPLKSSKSCIRYAMFGILSFSARFAFGPRFGTSQALHPDSTSFFNRSTLFVLALESSQEVPKRLPRGLQAARTAPGALQKAPKALQEAPGSMLEQCWINVSCIKELNLRQCDDIPGAHWDQLLMHLETRTATS